MSSRIKSTCKCDAFCRTRAEIQVLLVFSAKNLTVNDASGVTMLFAEAGMIFGVPQNNNSVLHVSFPSVILDNV